MPHKKEGFNNQISYILPETTQLELQSNPLTNLLFTTDIGFYPKAQYHFRERNHGCDQHILIFCTEGNGWVRWDSSFKALRKGMFAIIPAHMAHSYGSENDDPWSIYWLHFKGEKSDLLVSDSINIGDTATDESSRNDRRIRLFEEIFQNLAMGYSRENLHYTSICLWYLLGSFNFVPQFERIRATQPGNTVEKSIIYMSANIDKDLSLNQIADHCQLSVSHFSKIFKSSTQHSPKDYFNTLKVQRACQLLDHTSLKINDIAQQTGFADAFYFSRLFTKSMGLSPSAYRLQKKG